MPLALQATIDLSPLREFAKRLGHDIDRFDYTKPLAVCKNLLVTATKECFHGSHDPEGHKWKPLKHPRRKKGGRKYTAVAAQAPLIDTGTLWRSVGAGSGSVDVTGRFHFEYGTNVKYAAFQNDGTRTIPARPFLGITDKQADQFADVIANAVVRQLAGG